MNRLLKINTPYHVGKTSSERMSMYDDTYVHRQPKVGCSFGGSCHAGGDVAAFDTPLSANLVEYGLHWPVHGIG